LASGSSHILDAAAYDKAGNRGNATPVNIVVNNPPPVVTLRADRTIIDSGQSITLSWSVTNADSCVANGGWGGAPDPDGGSQAIGPLIADTSFSLSCTGPGGSDTDRVKIIVKSTIPGDLNSDSHVTVTDLSILLSHYGQSGQTLSTGDCNNDGSVTVIDLSILLSHYGT
jgi:hypothetical protein